MQRLTEQGQTIINDLAARYGVSNDAVMTMLDAVMKGNGRMAQFNHSDFGGAGQWMQGGMTMVGDMFNYALKSKVEGLCAELSNLVLSLKSDLFMPMSSQSQTQGGWQQGNNQVSLFVSGTGGHGNWWPAELDVPASTGVQNNIKYAYFPSNCRLAVEIDGHITVYDTQDHNIGGVSQQQSGDASLTFTSQYGLVRVENLPVISIDGAPPPQPEEAVPPEPNEGFGNTSNSDIFKQIEQLADLRKKDILTEDEFSAKKAELLKRL